MTDLSACFSDLAAQLLSSGGVLPIRMVGIARNGSAFVVTYRETEDGVDVDFTLDPTGHMVFPVNIITVDARGEAAHVVIGSEAVSIQ